MAYVPEVVLDLYNGIPKDCFVSGVPFTLRGFEDNEVIPSHDSTVPGPDGVQSKWVRFCDYLPFVDACKAYWMGSLLLEHPMYVYVMPYAPLKDAFCLHELIQNPDELPPDASFIQDVAVQTIGAATPQLRQGKVEVSDGETFSFFVVNYTLLHSKACQYSVMSYVTDPLHECLRRLQISNNLLHASTPRATIEQLVLSADDARRRLALVLMEKYTDGVLGVDPHEALLAMYPAIHDDVYQGQCECHNPDQEGPPISRIESAMQELGYEELEYDELSIGQAEKNLMNSEGAVEFHNYKANAQAKFTSAINPAIDYVRVATTSHSLMGVLTRYEDGDPEEGN